MAIVLKQALVFFGATAWIVSRVLKQFIRLYGIRMLRNSGFNVNEILLVFEAIANIMIGFVAIILYAESQNFPWIGLFAGASLGGVVLGLAVSKTAEDFLATLLLYSGSHWGVVRGVGVPPPRRGTAPAPLYLIDMKTAIFR